MDSLHQIFEDVKGCNECESISMNGFTFYDIGVKQQKIMMILQNPGFPTAGDLGTRVTEEQQKDDLPFHQRIRWHQKYFLDWLKKDNNKFSHRFVDTLIKHSIISHPYDSWTQYLEENNSPNFFDDFYVTDVIRCRAQTSRLRNEYAHNCFQYLKREIELVQPKLIFVFSSRSWNEFYKTFRPNLQLLCPSTKLMNNYIDPDRKSTIVSNIHGFCYIFKYADIKSFVIPLVHFSQRIRNNMLRDSYFDYLEEGLNCYEAN